MWQGGRLLELLPNLQTYTFCLLLVCRTAGCSTGRFRCRCRARVQRQHFLSSWRRQLVGRTRTWDFCRAQPCLHTALCARHLCTGDLMPQLVIWPRRLHAARLHLRTAARTARRPAATAAPRNCAAGVCPSLARSPLPAGQLNRQRCPSSHAAATTVNVSAPAKRARPSRHHPRRAGGGAAAAVPAPPPASAAAAAVCSLFAPGWLACVRACACVCPSGAAAPALPWTPPRTCVHLWAAGWIHTRWRLANKKTHGCIPIQLSIYKFGVEVRKSDKIINNQAL